MLDASTKRVLLIASILGAMLLVPPVLVVLSSPQQFPETQRNATSHQGAKQTSGNNKHPKTTWEAIWDRTFEDPVAFYTLVLACFTGALSTIAVIQLGFIIRADETATIAANAATRSAKVAESVAATSFRQAKAAFFVNRPIVNCADVKLIKEQEAFSSERTRYRIVVTYENVGRTPAFVERIGQGSGIGMDILPGTVPVYEFQSAFPLHDRYGYGYGWESLQPVINPEEPFEFAAKDVLIITAQKFAELAVNRGGHMSEKILLWGQIRYRDYFDAVTEVGWLVLIIPRLDGAGFEKTPWQYERLPNFIHRRYYEKAPDESGNVGDSGLSAS